VNTAIAAAAQYLLYLLAAVAFVVWVLLDNRGKLVLAGQAVAALVLVGIGITVAAALHVDPRPFVHDPNSRPLFAHVADNGFPSDHSVAAAMLAALVFAYRRVLGVVVAVGAALMGVARVAAHVHHGQDIVAGLLIGAVAGFVGVWLVSRVGPVVEHTWRARVGARA
jgi:membrane-associated phospholipid phosphatase